MPSSAFPAGFYIISNDKKSILCPSGLPDQSLKVVATIGDQDKPNQLHWLVDGAGIFTSQSQGYIAIGNSKDKAVKSFNPGDPSVATIQLSNLFVVVEFDINTMTGKIVTNDKNKQYWGLKAGSELVHLTDSGVNWTFTPA